MTPDESPIFKRDIEAEMGILARNQGKGHILNPAEAARTIAMLNACVGALAGFEATNHELQVVLANLALAAAQGANGADNEERVRIIRGIAHQVSVFADMYERQLANGGASGA